MICTDCKVNLKRRRTTRGNKTVERENICPSCNQHYFSVEMFREDYDTLFEEQEKKLLLFSERYSELNDKYNRLIEALAVVSQAVKEGAIKR